MRNPASLEPLNVTMWHVLVVDFGIQGGQQLQPGGNMHTASRFVFRTPAKIDNNN